MNEEKKIAQAIFDAQKMREKSYVPEWKDGEIKGVKINTGFGKYKLTSEECLIAVCKKNGLSSNLWYLLSLATQATHWWNDVQLWAEDILAGKDIETGKQSRENGCECKSK